MVKKKAEELKQGDKILLGGEVLAIDSIELSDVGKQGVKKCRIVAKKSNNEEVIVIRPSNYPMDVK